jgi:hypothetical protein
MSMTRLAVFLLFTAIFFPSGEALAHHGGAAYAPQPSQYEATITEFRFINPHALIFFDATDSQGKVTHWICEAVDPASMERHGWSHSSLKPGDHVTVFGRPAKNGTPIMALVKLVLANGQELLARVS